MTTLSDHNCSWRCSSTESISSGGCRGIGGSGAERRKDTNGASEVSEQLRDRCDECSESESEDPQLSRLGALESTEMLSMSSFAETACGSRIVISRAHSDACPERCKSDGGMTLQSSVTEFRNVRDSSVTHNRDHLTPKLSVRSVSSRPKRIRPSVDTARLFLIKLGIQDAIAAADNICSVLLRSCDRCCSDTSRPTRPNLDPFWIHLGSGSFS